MPYTEKQLRGLSGMGIVPWIGRAKSAAEAEAVLSAVVATESPAVQETLRQAQGEELTTSDRQNASVHSPAIKPIEPTIEQNEPAIESQRQTASHDSPIQHELMQTPLVEIPFRGKRCLQLGKSDAPLLILVEATSHQQKQYPFEAADAKIFDDMLRAIAWRRQDVCLAVLAPSGQGEIDLPANGPCVADLCKPHRDAVLLFRHAVPSTQVAEDLLVPMQRESMMAWQLPHPQLLRASPDRKRQAWNVLKAARARLQ